MQKIKYSLWSDLVSFLPWLSRFYLWRGLAGVIIKSINTGKSLIGISLFFQPINNCAWGIAKCIKIRKKISNFAPKRQKSDNLPSQPPKRFDSMGVILRMAFRLIFVLYCVISASSVSPLPSLYFEGYSVSEEMENTQVVYVEELANTHVYINVQNGSGEYTSLFAFKSPILSLNTSLYNCFTYREGYFSGMSYVCVYANAFSENWSVVYFAVFTINESTKIYAEPLQIFVKYNPDYTKPPACDDCGGSPSPTEKTDIPLNITEPSINWTQIMPYMVVFGIIFGGGIIRGAYSLAHRQAKPEKIAPRLIEKKSVKRQPKRIAKRGNEWLAHRFPDMRHHYLRK